MNKPVIILGAGGHAKVLVEALRCSDREIIGLTDPAMRAGDNFYGVACLGADETLKNYSVDEIELVNGLGAVPGNPIRWRLAERMRKQGYRFANIFHPSAVIAEGARFAEGVQIMAGVVAQPGVTIGLDSIINTGVKIDHDCHVGSNCHLAPGVTICGNATICDGVYVGAGAVVIQGVTIGVDSLIGAGCLILHHIDVGTKFIQKRSETVGKLQQADCGTTKL